MFTLVLSVQEFYYAKYWPISNSRDTASKLTKSVYRSAIFFNLNPTPNPTMRPRVSAGVQVSSTIVVSGRAKIRDTLANSSLQGFGTGSG